MKTCLLCKETRCLEKAHLVPRLLTRNVKNTPNAWTIGLCPTHHKCYDRFKLTKEEVEIIRPYADTAMLAAVELHAALQPLNNKPETLKVHAEILLRIRYWVRNMYGVIYG